MTPKLSIIVPIYNVEPFLGECLESVVQQNCSEIEIILVEDCSTDNSLSVAKQYLKEMSNGSLIEHSHNQGLGPARNSGLRAAKGEYIAFLDSDDSIEPGAIADILQLVEQSTFDLAQMGCNKVYLDRTEHQLYLDVSRSKQTTLQEAQKHCLELPSYAWMKIYRTAFLKQEQLEFSNIYYEDIPWSIDCILKAQSIVRTELCFYNYRQRAGSIVNSVSDKHLDMLSAYGLIFDTLKTRNISWKLNRAIDNGFAKSAYYLFRERLIRLGTSSEDKYFSHLSKATKARLILPTKPKAIAMWGIIASKQLFHSFRKIVRLGS